MHVHGEEGVERICYLMEKNILGIKLSSAINIKVHKTRPCTWFLSVSLSFVFRTIMPVFHITLTFCQ